VWARGWGRGAARPAAGIKGGKSARAARPVAARKGSTSARAASPAAARKGGKAGKAGGEGDEPVDGSGQLGS